VYTVHVKLTTNSRNSFDDDDYDDDMILSADPRSNTQVDKNVQNRTFYDIGD